MSIHQKHLRGQALIMVTLALIAMTGMLGFAIDLGWSYFRRQNLQGIAEAAALAAVQKALTTSLNCNVAGGVTCQAATACPNPVSPTLSPAYNNVQVGCYYASVYNNFATTGSQSLTMTANTTPSVPPTANAITRYWVTARASESILQPFSSVMGRPSLVTTVRATAAVVRVPLGGCINVLDPTGTTLAVSGNAGITAPGCNIFVGSNSASAVTVGGNASIAASTIGTFRSPPGVVVSGNGTIGATTTKTIGALSNPMSGITPPSPGSCTQTNLNVGANSTVNLGPGTYCGGIHLSGNATANFSSGTYVLLGGGFNVSGNVTVNGNTGVSFYNTFDGSHAFSPISISSNATIDLFAPSITSGQPLPGILFMQNTSVPSGTNNSITGNANSTFHGVVYIHDAATQSSTLTYTANASTVQALNIVVDDLTLAGNANLSIDSTASEGLQVISKALLVE